MQHPGNRVCGTRPCARPAAGEIQCMSLMVLSWLPLTGMLNADKRRVTRRRLVGILDSAVQRNTHRTFPQGFDIPEFARSLIEFYGNGVQAML